MRAPNVDTRKVRAAANAMVSVIEYLGDSGLRQASGDSLLIDHANDLFRRIIEDAKRVGIDATP